MSWADRMVTVLSVLIEVGTRASKIPCKAVWLTFMVGLFAQPSLGAAGDCSDEPDVYSWPYPSGGLVFEPNNPLRLQEERVTISDDIDVEYVLANDTDRTVTMVITFPIPEQHTARWETSMRSIDPHDQDFSVWVNGRPVEARTDVKASSGKRDITARLRELGVDPTNDELRDVRLKRELLKLGAACKCSDSDDDSEAFACWSVQTTYTFTQIFPPKSTVAIRHVFTPWAESEPASPNLLVPACGKENEEAACEEAIQAGVRGTVTTISFDQAKLSNLNGPIGRFTLTIDPGDMLLVGSPDLRGLSLTEMNGKTTGVAENFFLQAAISVTLVKKDP